MRQDLKLEVEQYTSQPGKAYLEDCRKRFQRLDARVEKWLFEADQIASSDRAQYLEYRRILRGLRESQTAARARLQELIAMEPSSLVEMRSRCSSVLHDLRVKMAWAISRFS
jgi:hypothetical protein